MEKENEKIKLQLFQSFYRVKQAHMMNVIKDVTPQEYMLLEAVYGLRKKHPELSGISVSKLAYYMKQKTPAISRTLGNLEKAGYLVRTVSPTDRRTTYVVLSEAGDVIRLNGRKQVNLLMARVMDEMGSEDMTQLITLMERLAVVMTEEVKKMERDK